MSETRKPGNTIAERSISAFPISIGTSLCLESLFDPRLPAYDSSREIPERIDLTKYQECWISLYTLYRNINGACSKQASENMSVSDLLSTLEQEIDTIVNLFLIEGKGLIKPYFYYNDYQSVIDKYTKRKVFFRDDKTEQQKVYSQRFLKAMGSLVGKNTEHHKFNGEIKPVNPMHNGIIITHIPYDLLSHSKFKRLSLLESHTGVMKPKYNWSSKYAPVGERDLSNLPFLRRLLLIFGDKVLIKPSFYELRTKILDTAEKRHWTSFSTDDRVMYDLELDIKEPMVLDFIRKL